MGEWLFLHAAKPPQDLWFLRAASHLQSYVPSDAVAELVRQEEEAGLLRGLAEQYEASGKGGLLDLARDLRCLRHFLGLAHARGEAAFLCYRGE